MSTPRRESGDARVGARDPLLWVSLLVAFAVRGVPVVLYPEMAISRDEAR